MTARKATPKPTKKAEKACYDLLHRAWMAGAISDFRYGTSSNSLAVPKGTGTDQVGWTVDLAFFHLSETAAVVGYVEHALACAGIVSMTWGPRWMGGRVLHVERTASERVA